jgi:hypothetical protein
MELVAPLPTGALRVAPIGNELFELMPRGLSLTTSVHTDLANGFANALRGERPRWSTGDHVAAAPSVVVRNSPTF